MLGTIGEAALSSEKETNENSPGRTASCVFCINRLSTWAYLGSALWQGGNRER